MENMNNKGSTTASIETKVMRLRLGIQSLAFTGILYFCVGQTPPTTTNVIDNSVGSGAMLSASVEKGVLQHASQKSGLPTSALRIVRAQAHTWSDNCLGMRDSIFCTQISVPGWQVAVASEKQSWIYRTNASGSLIKMEQDTSVPSKESKGVALAIAQLFQQLD